MFGRFRQRIANRSGHGANVITLEDFTSPNKPENLLPPTASVCPRGKSRGKDVRKKPPLASSGCTKKTLRKERGNGLQDRPNLRRHLDPDPLDTTLSTTMMMSGSTITTTTTGRPDLVSTMRSSLSSSSSSSSLSVASIAPLNRIDSSFLVHQDEDNHNTKNSDYPSAPTDTAVNRTPSSHSPGCGKEVQDDDTGSFASESIVSWQNGRSPSEGKRYRFRQRQHQTPTLKSLPADEDAAPLERSFCHTSVENIVNHSVTATSYTQPQTTFTADTTPHNGNSVVNQDSCYTSASLPMMESSGSDTTTSTVHHTQSSLPRPSLRPTFDETTLGLHIRFGTLRSHPPSMMVDDWSDVPDPPVFGSDAGGCGGADADAAATPDSRAFSTSINQASHHSTATPPRRPTDVETSNTTTDGPYLLAKSIDANLRQVNANVKQLEHQLAKKEEQMYHVESQTIQAAQRHDSYQRQYQESQQRALDQGNELQQAYMRIGTIRDHIALLQEELAKEESMLEPLETSMVLSEQQSMQMEYALRKHRNEQDGLEALRQALSEEAASLRRDLENQKAELKSLHVLQEYTSTNGDNISSSINREERSVHSSH